MSVRTRNSFVWLWLAALLSASIGISVQQVYCYCVGKTRVSLFTAEDACHIEKKAAKLASCCQKPPLEPQPTCCEKPDLKKKGCTKKSTKIFQLKTESEVAGFELKKLEVPKFWALASAFSLLSDPLLGFQVLDYQNFERPPPKLSGRMICIRHGVFLC